MSRIISVSESSNRQNTQSNHQTPIKANLSPVTKKHPFSVEEDIEILQFVQAHGTKNWRMIALQLGRTPKQCRERWNGHLNPTINKGPWTIEEDLILAQKQNEIGNKWAEISKFLPGRTDTIVKNRWNTSVKNRAEELLRMEYFSNSNVSISADCSDCLHCKCNQSISPSSSLSNVNISSNTKNILNTTTYNQNYSTYSQIAQFIQKDSSETSYHVPCEVVIPMISNYSNVTINTNNNLINEAKNTNAAATIDGNHVTEKGVVPSPVTRWLSNFNEEKNHFIPSLMSIESLPPLVIPVKK
ncbi:hypothetical protein TRFO_39569 [Tritrichomonas foetus]|uniref:Myb-like DNA-binding domain containing protein n=1 Tax=Tritrichomonas foetus TaxID=1144522 RepID=A0A1J4J6F2_9EUKA|nr:hypothetical protein TRFO_39569 [Tritrichomonas foetus]|eukprot:OHS94241.1 hypothetical protein TRFO_39569 [Tritrichomonas foetus]